MSVNGTLPTAGYVATLLDSAQEHVFTSAGRVALLALLYSPIVAIVLNVLKQLVRVNTPGGCSCLRGL